jgi:hypothetical protein
VFLVRYELNFSIEGRAGDAREPPNRTMFVLPAIKSLSLLWLFAFNYSSSSLSLSLSSLFRGLSITLWRHTGEWRNRVPEAGELSALRLGGITGRKICPGTYCIGGCASPELVWKIWRREKPLTSTRNWTLIRLMSAHSLVPILAEIRLIKMLQLQYIPHKAHRN